MVSSDKRKNQIIPKKSIVLISDLLHRYIRHLRSLERASSPRYTEIHPRSYRPGPVAERQAHHQRAAIGVERGSHRHPRTGQREYHVDSSQRPAVLPGTGGPAVAASEDPSDLVPQRVKRAHSAGICPAGTDGGEKEKYRLSFIIPCIPDFTK